MRKLIYGMTLLALLLAFNKQVWGINGLFDTKPTNDPAKSSDSLQVSLDTLENQLSAIHKKSLIPGFVGQVIQKDSIIYSKGFGYADVANQHEFTPQTIHTIASISKTFIGVAIMKLVEDGKLNLDDPVNKWLPFEIWNPYFPQTTITVRHLVTHTSSLNDEFDDGDKRPSQLVEKPNYNTKEIPTSLAEDIYYFDGSILPLEDYIKQIFTPKGKWYDEQNFSEFQPGEKYEYSNEGATLAALIVERVSEKSFPKFTQEHIFEPLKMNQTFWFYKDLDSTFSKLYMPNDYNQPTKVFEFPRFNEANYPAGDLKSNADDLSKYLIEMMNGFKGQGKILNAQSYQTLLNPQLDKGRAGDPDEGALNDEYNVGVFWAISEPGLRLHKGGSLGVYSILYFNPKNEIGIIAYCNLAHPDFGAIVGAFREFEKKIKQ